VDFRTVGVRNHVEKLIYWLLRPCRCGLCGKHFFLFRWQTDAAEAA